MATRPSSEKSEMVYEEETESGERGRSILVHPEFGCILVGGELKSVSSVVTQLCYRGSEECKCKV